MSINRYLAKDLNFYDICPPSPLSPLYSQSSCQSNNHQLYFHFCHILPMKSVNSRNRIQEQFAEIQKYGFLALPLD